MRENRARSWRKGEQRTCMTELKGTAIPAGLMTEGPAKEMWNGRTSETKRQEKVLSLKLKQEKV